METEELRGTPRNSEELRGTPEELPAPSCNTTMH
jgi:hypothetical protein